MTGTEWKRREFIKSLLASAAVVGLERGARGGRPGQPQVDHNRGFEGSVREFILRMTPQ